MKIWGILLIALFITFTGRAQQLDYLAFDQVSLQPDASVVNCMLRDAQGLLWIGSDKGLYSYDGHLLQRHFSFTDFSSTHIYCMVRAGKNILYLGTDNGVLIYNILKDSYVSVPVVFPTDVRSLLLQKNNLWIGSFDGLYLYNRQHQTIKNFSGNRYPGLSNHTIYALLQAADNSIYLGTYNGLYHYFPGTDQFHKVRLPFQQGRNNQFVNSLLEDTVRNCIWIGTERQLFRYFPGSGKVEKPAVFRDNSVKSLALDKNTNLLIGTDNGLYVYAPDKSLIRHIIHDSRNSKSLINNIIWTVFVDREKNVWLGTDLGISLFRNNDRYQTIPIDQITGIGEGNRFYNLLKDHRGNFWLGGANGVIQVQAGKEIKKARWFRMGNPKNPLVNNRVRDLYEDPEGQLWMATDGGINRFDRASGQFVHYNIVDRTGTNNANWAYDIFEDPRGKLWIASCLGGIFRVDREGLIHSSPGKIFIAGKNFSVHDGLSGDFVNQIVPGRKGRVAWVLIYNKGINRIQLSDGTISRLSVGQRSAGFIPNYILVDRDNNLWIGGSGEMIRYNPNTGKTKHVPLVQSGHMEILSVTEEHDWLWICTTRGVFVLNLITLQTHSLSRLNQSFTSSYFDRKDNLIYLGGVDRLVCFSPSTQNLIPQESPFFVTSLLINNRPLQKIRPQGESIRYLKRITLNYDENNLTMSLSDFIFSDSGRANYSYRLEGFDDNWKVPGESSFMLSYARLHYGDYRLLIGRQNSEGKVRAVQQLLLITIRPPWYYTFTAKIVYLILLAGLALWTIIFFNVRNRLKIERLEREKLVELSELKIRFFTDVSHEFKTPLSLILGPVSRMIAEMKDHAGRKELELIRRNALRLNSLIHQALDFNRMDQKMNTELLLSKVEFVGFSRSLFENFKESSDNKLLHYSFSSNLPAFYVQIDQIKMEAVLANILSNACKFSGDGGHLNMQLTCNPENQTVGVAVRDDGIGIAEEDLPHVTERFYQTKQTARRIEGTGLGLYLVKNYLDLHHCVLRIQSDEASGTVVSFCLPTGEETQQGKGRYENAVENNQKAKILIVEDNVEIADFISVVLGKEYCCQVAVDGKDGLEQCRRFQPDLIIADIMMPVMDGLEMCGRIRQLTAYKSVPIILLTAKDDQQTELESIQLNIDAFMPKPFDIQILASRIRQLLQKKQEMERKVHLEALTRTEEEEKLSQDEEMLSKITRIIEEKLDDTDFNVEVLSRDCGWHKKQIYRKLKQLTGMSTVEYIKSIRMKKAAMYLSQKKFTVAEVMYMVGFSSSSYFSKCFQNEFGETPRQFMEKKN